MRSVVELFDVVKPYTMSWYRDHRGNVKYPKLNVLYDLANRVVTENLPGDYAEFGVFAGGSSGVVGEVLKNTDKKLWLFDSWEGLPEPTAEDTANKERSKKAKAEKGMCCADIEKVRELVTKLGIEDKTVLCKGFFKDSFPTYEQEIHNRKLSFLNIDCDWYDSYNIVLNTFFDDVVPGGYVVIDDYYYWEGCKKAVNEFFDRKNFHPKLHPTDRIGVWFQVPKLQ